MDAVTAAKIAQKAIAVKKASGKSLGQIIFIIAVIPLSLICITFTVITYLLTTPLGQVAGLFKDNSIEFPEIIKDFKGQEHFITYAYISNNWRCSPPTYNNKIIEDYSEPEYDEEGNLVDEGHPSITFGGSSLFYRRYAYAVDKGTVTAVTDNSVTVQHQWGECIVTDSEGKIISRHPTIYDVTYTNVEYDKKYCDEIKVGDEVLPGQKLYKIKLWSNMDFSVVRVCHEPKPFNPHGFVPTDTVENAPDESEKDNPNNKQTNSQGESSGNHG